MSTFTALARRNLAATSYGLASRSRSVLPASLGGRRALATAPADTSSPTTRSSKREKSNQLRTSSFHPIMDVHEDKAKNQITSTFELPGLKKDDVDITLDDHNRLTVSGKSSMSNTQDIEGYTVRERMFGSFSRSLQLPEGIKRNQIKASMNNGVLTVAFPKSPAEEGDSHKIPVH